MGSIIGDNSSSVAFDFENERYGLWTENGQPVIRRKGTKENPEYEHKWVATFSDRAEALNYMNFQNNLDAKFEEALKQTLERYGEALKQMPTD